MFKIYFPAFDYLSQEDYATYEEARAAIYSKGFSGCVMRNENGQWQKVTVK